mgnify:CR=1 FL=1
MIRAPAVVVARARDTSRPKYFTGRNWEKVSTSSPATSEIEATRIGRPADFSVWTRMPCGSLSSCLSRA